MDEVTEESVGVASYEAGKREMHQQELNGWHGLGVIAFLLIVILICSSSYTIYIYNFICVDPTCLMNYCISWK